MNVLYSCDDKYCPYTGISITSLFESNKDLDDINVYVLAHRICEANAIKLNRLAKQYDRNILILDAEEIDRFLTDHGVIIYQGSRATYYRLFVEQLIPKNIDRILYIDSDTIVVGSLANLDGFQFNESKACAMTYERFFRGYNAYLGLKETDKYYMGGIILFDMNNWRTLNCSEKILSAINEGRTYFLTADQDILNYSINEHIQVLPPKYNVLSDWAGMGVRHLHSFKDASESNFYSLSEIKDAMQNPVILHCKKMSFVNDVPWVHGNRNPFEQEWLKYKKLSLWHDIPTIVKKANKKDNIRKFLLLTLPRSLYLKITKYETKRYITNYYREDKQRG